MSSNKKTLKSSDSKKPSKRSTKKQSPKTIIEEITEKITEVNGAKVKKDNQIVKYLLNKSTDEIQHETQDENEDETQDETDNVEKPPKLKLNIKYPNVSNTTRKEKKERIHHRYRSARALHN